VTIEVSIVIPVLDAEGVLERQVDAILPQLGPDAELVLVDNGSTDGTAAVIERYVRRCPGVRSVHAPTRGVNRARNAGIAAARGRSILLCDADDVVQPGWVEAFRSALGAAELAGGAVRGVDAAGNPVPHLDPASVKMFGFASPWGCCCALRRETWERVGGFDERMSGGYDETDFFLRAQLLGASLTWTDEAVVEHLWDPAKQRRRERERSYHSRRVYWMGRVQGRPRQGAALRVAGQLAFGAPAALVSSSHRRAWGALVVRRWDRLRGLVRFGLPEIWRGITQRVRG
jgi:glycosyltransferase involved in cell wall biosynthesis